VSGSDDIRAWRGAERRRLLAARRALTGAERDRHTRAIARELIAQLADVRAPLVGVYAPLADEVDPRELVDHLRARGIEVALPVVVGPDRPLVFRRWPSEAALVRGAHGVAHPAAGEAVLPEALIVPLVGFDDAGYRLGYGAGYYDRTLAAYGRPPLTIGVGFELGRLATIHPQDHDRPLDRIVTETGVRRLR
jgi:5-formyltetrahydrofolate cyclo-ligase